MKILLCGMHRSGTNAVGRWLLRQSSLKSKNMDIVIDWVDMYTPYDGESFGFVSQINHPDHNYEPFKFDNCVRTIERESLGTFETYIEEMCGHNAYTSILLIRDFKNWAASSYKMSGNLPDNLDTQKYRTHLLEQFALYFSGEGAIYDMTINYNKWCADSEYRKNLCLTLGLRYTNCGFRDVPSNGGGSSFDGISMDGHAQDMKVLERYKEFESDWAYLSYLQTNEDLLDMSDKIFGEV